MPTLSNDEVTNIANNIKSTGLQINSYGGSTQTYHYNQTGLMQGTSINSQTQSQEESLGSKIANIGKSVGGLASKAVMFPVHAAEDVVGAAVKGAQFTFIDPARQISTNIAQIKLASKANSLDSQYKSGQITKQNYDDSISAINDQQATNDKSIQSMEPFQTAGQAFSNIADNVITALSLGGGTVVKGLFKGAAEDLVPKFIESSADSGEQLAKLVGPKGSQVFNAAGGKEVLNDLLDSSTNKLQQTLLKNAPLRNVVLNNMTNILKTGAQQQLVGETSAQFLQREAKSIAVGLLVKKPLFYQTNIQGAQSIYKDMASGKYGASAITAGLMALQAVEGGPIGAIASWGKKALSKLGDLTYGTGSFIDEVGKLTDNKIGEQLLEQKANDPAAFQQSEKLWRIFQEMNLQMANGDAKVAAQNFLQNHIYAGEDLSQLSKEDLEKEAQNHYDAQQLVKELGNTNIKGVDPEKTKNLVVARWDSVAKRDLANKMLQVGDDKGQMAAVLQGFNDQNGGSWTNNGTLMKQLIGIVNDSGSAEEAASKIKSIPTATGIPSWVPKKVAAQMEKLGYVPVLPQGGVRRTNYADYNDTRKLISAVSRGSYEAKQVFDPDTAPQPVLHTIGGFLTKAGLSPQAAQKQAYAALSKSVATNLDNSGIARDLGFELQGDTTTGGQVLLSKLQHYVDGVQAPAFLKGLPLIGKNIRPAITDIRQLSIGDIQKAVASDISRSTARGIKAAINKGYTDVPMELRGMGDKILDYAYRFNPLQANYSRLQSALRYSYNPFFQTQESFETKAFSGLSGGNSATTRAGTILNDVKHAPELWGKSGKELDATVQQLDNSGIFSSSLAGEAAQDQTIGRLTADITPGQKRDLAGLALDIANRQGRPLQDILDNNPEQIADALRVIVQYPQKGWLASPMARTLNLAFFPMRYNVKVLGMASKILSQQPPSVQFATIHSLLNLQNYMQSDEGIRWRQQNNDAIQLFNWISPLNNIEGVFNTLGYAKDKITGQPDNGVGSLGQLGGLPFGIISQVLDSMGIINLNSPYVNPQTGEVLPKYIPTTTKARAVTALEDIIGNVFTYPGRILGLPGKEGTIRNVVNSFADVPTSDYNIQDQTSQLTPMQQNLVRVLQGDTSKEAINSLYNSAAPGQYKGYTLPPSVLPFNIPGKVPVESRTAVAASKAAQSTSSTKTKKTSKPIGQF